MTMKNSHVKLLAFAAVALMVATFVVAIPMPDAEAATGEGANGTTWTIHKGLTLNSQQTFTHEGFTWDKNEAVLTNLDLRFENTSDDNYATAILFDSGVDLATVKLVGSNHITVSTDSSDIEYLEALDTYSGDLVITGPGSLTIDVILNNDMNYNGLYALYSDDDITIDGCEITINITGQHTGSNYIYTICGDDVFIKNHAKVTINNEAVTPNYNEIYDVDAYSLSVTDSKLIINDSKEQSVGICIDYLLSIDNSKVHAEGGSGAIVMDEDDCEIVLNNVSLRGGNNLGGSPDKRIGTDEIEDYLVVWFESNDTGPLVIGLFTIVAISAIVIACSFVRKP